MEQKSRWAELKNSGVNSSAGNLVGELTVARESWIVGEKRKSREKVLPYEMVLFGNR
jgi:hypothetical protein